MVTREKVKSEFQRKNSSLSIRWSDYITISLIKLKTLSITGHHRKLALRGRDWKLGLPNWHRLGVGKREKREGREAGPYCRSERKVRWAARSCSQGTATLIYSPCKLSEVEPQEEQYWARRGIGGHMVIGNQKSRQSPGSHGDVC